MKQIVFLLVSFLFSIKIINAQGETASPWFAPGVQWYYGIADDGMSGGTGCIRMSVDGDTLLAGRTCKRLLIESCDGSYAPLHEYVYPDGDRLFYYNLKAEDFFLLADMAAQKGDTIWVHEAPFLPNPGFDPYRRWREFGDETGLLDKYTRFMAYRIMEVDTVVMAGKSLRRQRAEAVVERKTDHGKETSWWEFPGWAHPEYGFIVEGVGSFGGFFGEIRGLYPEWGKCWLRCFRARGETYLTDGGCDDVGTEKMSVRQTVAWRLSPQPAKGIVRANCTVAESSWLEGRWRMFDLTGKMLRAGTFAGGGFELSVDGLPAGLYLIEIDAGNGRLTRLKCLVSER